jgi:hypothetical protein
MRVRLRFGSAFETSERDVVARCPEGPDLFVNNTFNPAMHWRCRKMDEGNFHCGGSVKERWDAPANISFKNVACTFISLLAMATADVEHSPSAHSPG